MAKVRRSRPQPPPGARQAYPGKIRIIGGQWRGRKLPVPAQEGLRPTPDRVRETLFNWLMPVIQGARCLDLFAGTGALCLEALSRGAGEVVMVERAGHVAEQLRRNIETLQTHGATVIQTDAVDFLYRKPEPFDVIFLDPPFASDLVKKCAELIEGHGWLKPGGFVYVEAPHILKPLPVPSIWEMWRSGTAGEVAYSLLRLSSR